jgi:integrase/recombinase XerD
LAPSERASSASQPRTRVRIRYASRKATAGDHAARAVDGDGEVGRLGPERPGQRPCHGSRHPHAKDRAASRFLAYLVEAGVDDLATLDVRDVSGFLLRQRGLRRKTIAAMRSCLADFLGFLAAAGRTPHNLADRLPPHRHVRHESEPHLWTVDEIRRTLAGIDRRSVTGKRDYAMILTTARLGLRISDLRRLELGDLDWRAKQITIVQHKTGRR